MRKKSFFVKTLGCKVNQVESAYILEKLNQEGFFLENEDKADILILNSCAVTEKADKEVYKILKKWLRFNPQLIVLAGCYSQKFSHTAYLFAKKFNMNNFLILGHREKFRISEILKEVLEKEKLKLPLVLVGDVFQDKICEPLFIHKFFGHSRAFVKVQDGCDNFCSYCIVPNVRGKPRSVSLENVLKQIEIFINEGYEEIVLTGIHLGKWGVDLNPPKKLTDLLIEIERFLKSFNKNFHLRLSSIEVKEIDKDFLEFLKNSNFIVPHFHIPLQSGSNKILKLMNRDYTKEEYLEVLNKLYEIFPHATFGADVIVGFPGEEERDFNETYKVIKESPLNWLHIFPFSSRPGTFAESLNPKVSPGEIEKRKKILKELIKEKRQKFLEKEIGKVRRILLEYFDKNTNMWKALSENYISNFVKIGKEFYFFPGKIVKVKFKELKGDYLIGEPLKNFQNKNI